MFLNWVNRVEGSGTEQAMIFRRKQGDNRAICVLRWSELHTILDSRGYWEGQKVYMAARIAESIGFFGDQFAAKNVRDLVTDFADDLREMPSTPPNAVELALAGPKAELEIKLDGETVLEKEVAA